MWAVLVGVVAAFAGEGFYHYDDVAAKSRVYLETSDVMAPRFEQSSRTSESLALALREYELALDLLGDRAPTAERERLDALSREYNREFAVLQSFVETSIADYQAAFAAGLERAITKHPEAKLCAKHVIASGPGRPAVRKPNPNCVGEDMNAALAALMDQDKTLIATVEEITRRPWPEIALEPKSQAPVSAGDRHILVTALFRAGAAESLARIDKEDALAREPFEIAVEQGASKEELERLVDEAHAVSAVTAKTRAELASPVLVASDAQLAKWQKKGEPATGWCANPVLLGGCSGTDDTRELVSRLLEAKKVASTLQ